MDEQETRQFVVGAANGNQEDFARLYDIYGDPIYRFVFFRVRTKEDAEDLAQTIFVKAWNAIQRADGEKLSFRSWIYTIARNTVIDHWKKKKDLQVGKDDEDFFERIADTTRTQEERAMLVDDAHALKKHMTDLTDEQQEVLKLRFFDDLDTEEIARILKRKPEAVRALQYRALESLRDKKENFYD